MVDTSLELGINLVSAMKSFLDCKAFADISNLIYNASGICFDNTNKIVLEGRLKERLSTLKIPVLDDYLSALYKDKEELKFLLDLVTTNLTRFFRNTAHFNTLEKFVLPAIVEKKKQARQTKVRIWSAGCSTGEEPYSIAMMARETLPVNFSVEIIGSDLSLKSLMSAKEGYYSKKQVKGIPKSYLAKYFKKEGDGYQVSQSLKDDIEFDYHNLRFNSGLSDLDIIFCRNVIIYFDKAAQEELIQKFWNALNRYSFLFVGHSESLFAMKSQFRFRQTGWGVVYEKI